MTRTTPPALVILFLGGFGLGWVTQVLLVSAGRSIILPPLSLAVVLGLLAGALVILALPVNRVARGTATRAIDPFYATRVVILAKASSLGGALLAGGAVAILAFLLTRPVMPAVSSTAASGAVVGGAVLLMVAGLVAEKMCTLPPKDDTPARPGLKEPS